MVEKKVSIIIPIFNVEPFLPRCIDSVVSQTYKNLDIILVNDGSIDKSGSICEKYKRIDSRIHVINKKNGGLSDARNAGINIAEGEFLFFLDADDYIDLNTIQGMMEAQIQTSSDIVECGIRYVYSDGVELFDEQQLSIARELNHDEAVHACLDYELKIMAWNKLYRKELFENTRYPYGKINEDEATTPYLVDKANKYVIVKNKYYRYYQRAGSIMNSGITKRNLDILYALNEKFKFFSTKYYGKYDEIILYHNLCAIAALKTKIIDKKLEAEIFDAIQKENKKTFERIISNECISNKTKIKAFLTYLFPKSTSKLRVKRSLSEQ